MIEFKLDFTDETITVYTDKKTITFDNAKNASEAVYNLLIGIDELEGEEAQENVIAPFDHRCLYFFAQKNMRYNDNAPSLINVFFEELHLALFIRGQINE